MKKIFGILLLLLGVLTLTSCGKQDETKKKEEKKIVVEEITEGTIENTFSPEMPSTRAQMVTFIWRAAGCPESTGIDMPFEAMEEKGVTPEDIQVEHGTVTLEVLKKEE